MRLKIGVCHVEVVARLRQSGKWLCSASSMTSCIDAPSIAARIRISVCSASGIQQKTRLRGGSVSSCSVFSFAMLQSLAERKQLHKDNKRLDWESAPKRIARETTMIKLKGNDKRLSLRLKPLALRLRFYRSDWTKGAWRLSLDVSWHRRDTWIYGAGYTGNRTAWIGRKLKRCRGMENGAPVASWRRWSAGWFSGNSNAVATVPY